MDFENLYPVLAALTAGTENGIYQAVSELMKMDKDKAAKEAAELLNLIEHPGT